MKICDEALEEGAGDVQKKVQPWRQMLLDEVATSEVEHGLKPAPRPGLTLVTSLIDKVPNLGG